VWAHDALGVGVTVLRDDESFRFCYLDDAPTFDAFAGAAADVLAAARAAPADAPLEPQADRDDLLHGTVLPWLPFTSITHARRLPAADSVPKVAFGKFERRGDRVDMPVSLEVHHALVDGLHVGRFFERFTALLAAAEL
jgi:chloramphenicol O-acetyltransferase type A